MWNFAIFDFNDGAFTIIDEIDAIHRRLGMPASGRYCRREINIKSVKTVKRPMPYFQCHLIRVSWPASIADIISLEPASIVT